LLSITRKTLAGLFAGSVAATALAVGAAPAHAATDIKVGVTPINSTGALQYAIDSGIMAKNGLNVTEVVTFPAPPPSIAALAAGAVQFTYSPTIPAINAYENGGVALRIVAPADGYLSRDLAKAKKDAAYAIKIDDTGVCVKPDSGINSWKDLVGKTVSVPARGAQAEVTIASAVKKAGGDASKINWVTLGLPQVISSVQSGAINAGFTVEPFTTNCTAAGLKNIGSPGIQFFDTEQAIGVWVTTQTFANSNPQAVLAFQKSIYEANSFAMKSAANSRKVTLASTKITGVPAAQALAANPTYYPLFVTRADVLRPATKMFELGFLKKQADVAGMLVKQYRPKK
jgi:ABC-type nitrate/sulfonate/bicarbonate transport system substrate-binding protein